MSLLDVTYPKWMDRAACIGSDADFFPEMGHTATAARKVCAGCPVRDACLQWALENGFEHGVFGGVGARDRRWLQADTAAHQCPTCPRAFRNKTALASHVARYCGVRSHGTHGAYGNGCRCESCKAAHASYMRARRASRAA